VTPPAPSEKIEAAVLAAGRGTHSGWRELERLVSLGDVFTGVEDRSDSAHAVCFGYDPGSSEPVATVFNGFFAGP
jgi:hypothetical protein